MKTCSILIAVVIITLFCPGESAQLKSNNRRETRYPTRQPQSLFPDQLKVSRTRIYRSIDQQDNYRFDERDQSDGNVVPKRDSLIIGRPGKLLQKNLDEKKKAAPEDEKFNAIMTNYIDDSEDDEGYGSNYGYSPEGLPKKRKRVLAEKAKTTIKN